MQLYGKQTMQASLAYKPDQSQKVWVRWNRWSGDNVSSEITLALPI
jgi:hypothetical protein